MHPKNTLPYYEVAAAVICQNGKFLIAQRLPESALGGLWEFPGGKQEAGETLPRCLQREIQEELGLDIAVGQPIISVWHNYSHCQVTVHAFYCRLLKGRPQNLAVADWRWVTLAEIEAFPFPPVDLKIIVALKNDKKPHC